MSRDLRYFEAIAEKAQERRSKRKANEAEVLRRIRRVKIAAGVDLPPTDLNKLARHIGISDIRNVPLAMKGRLILKDNSFKIEINNNLSDFEKRYTVAHELAHLIVEEKSLNEHSFIRKNGKEQSSRPYLLTENLCDLGAEEILLPCKWLQNRIRDQGPSLEIIEQISKEISCDLSFVAIQLIKLGLWHCKLLWCEKIENKLYVTKAFPRTDEAFLAFIDPFDLETSLPGNSLINKRFMEGHLRIKSGDEDYLYRAQCIPVDGKEVLSMLIYN